MGVIEQEAISILKNYEGFNNQILIWKNKIINDKHYTLTRTQCNYIKLHHKTKPKIARKNVTIADNFAEKLKEDKQLIRTPNAIWVEKILCETNKAFHIWGKLFENYTLQAFWIPKVAIIPEEKKIKYKIDYSKYDVIVDGEERSVLQHQKPAIEKLIANKRFMLADDMGLCKTGSSIIAALELNIKKTLVVCPASLKINWKREFENYTDKSIYIVDGKTWERDHDIYIINYDILKNFHATDKTEDSEDFKRIVNENFDLAIIDEAHSLSNTGANRTKLMTDILDNINRVWLLTGTPMTNRPINYFNLLKIMRSPLTLNWVSYVKRYCKAYQFKPRNSKRKIWNTSGSANIDELRQRTKHLFIRRLKTEVGGLPEKIINPIFIELFNEKYVDEINEFLKITEENKKEEKLSIDIRKLMVLRQIIAHEKINYTCEYIDKYINEGKKVIVFTNFTAVLDTLHEKYKKNSVVLDGRMNKTKKQVSIDQFQNDPETKLFIGNLDAAGVGITLTSAEVVIMNDLCFVPSNHLQAEDRCYRKGQKNNVIVYYPIFENTIEMIIYNILNKKKRDIDILMGVNPKQEKEEFQKEFIKELMIA